MIVLLRSFPSFSTKIIIYDNNKRIHLLLCLSVVVPIVFVKPETDRYDLFLVETDLYDLFSPVNPMSDNSFIVLPKGLVSSVINQRDVLTSTRPRSLVRRSIIVTGKMQREKGIHTCRYGKESTSFYVEGRKHPRKGRDVFSTSPNHTFFNFVVIISISINLHLIHNIIVSCNLHFLDPRKCSVVGRHVAERSLAELPLWKATLGRVSFIVFSKYLSD